MKTKVIELLKSTNRKGIDNLINHMETIGFFTCPASTSYHGSKECGLLEHSLNVFQFGIDNLSGLIETIPYENDFINSINSWTIASLLHDIGKASYRNKPNYIPNILKSGKISDSKPYERNSDRLFIAHEIVSIQILSQFIELTEEEEFAILYHNGMYTASGRDISGKERPLQQVLHFADMWCSRFIEVDT